MACGVTNLPDIKDLHRTVQLDHGELDANIGRGGRRRCRGWGWTVDDLIRLRVPIVACGNNPPRVFSHISASLQMFFKGGDRVTEKSLHVDVPASFVNLPIALPL